MFSYTINNPNNLSIDSNTDYNIIPFGHRCSSALAAKYANIRKCSFPFDWTAPTFPKKIQKVLENNFEDFVPNVTDTIINGGYTNKYDISLVHFNSDINKGIEEYTRRIIRFNDIINQSTKIYFIFINEDYLYNPKYRSDEFNDTMFEEMLELETFIKNKYMNINYNILYFNFKQHNIPINSNIINIVLNTDTFFDTGDGYVIFVYEQFRVYCGQILTELFKTNLTPGYNLHTFEN